MGLQQCNGVYIHPEPTPLGGATIALPTEAQFRGLIDFMLSSVPDLDQSPVPIRITTENRWRWDPHNAMAKHHIFRNRYERQLSPQYWRRRRRDVITKYSWPEIIEACVSQTQEANREAGNPVDKVALAAARERIKHITPTSKHWSWQQGEIARSQPDKKKQGRPPYLFDP